MRAALEDLYNDAVEIRAALDEDTTAYRLLDEVCAKLSEAMRIAADLPRLS